MTNETIKIERKFSEISGNWHIIATHENGFEDCLDMNIRTERGAKARLTYWRNNFTKRGQQVA